MSTNNSKKRRLVIKDKNGFIIKTPSMKELPPRERTGRNEMSPSPQMLKVAEVKQMHSPINNAKQAADKSKNSVVEQLKQRHKSMTNFDTIVIPGQYLIKKPPPVKKLVYEDTASSREKPITS